MNTEQRSAVVELPPMGNVTPEQAATKSLTHWVWPPYRDINNMGPIGIRSLLGYRGQAWTTLKRCTPYPLGNMTQFDVDRAAAENHSGFGLNSATLPKTEYVKYAQDQAKELADSYSDQGLRILIPLLGMDDRDLVTQIIQTVQPFEFALHEMAYEFSEGAAKRISNSNLSNEDKGRARELARILLAGACGKVYANGTLRDSATDAQTNATTKARAEYEALISSMSDKMAGGPGIANPSTAYQSHVWLCEQLNESVPARIDRTGGQGNSSAAIDVLAKRALKEESAAEAMATELAQERAERARLEEKVDALIAAQAAGTK